MTDMPSPDYNSEDFQSELFRLHSQLLTESWLVSFPPLNNMLKFSGYSCLIGGPKDGELCLSRPKPGETLVEGRSGSNVQIDRRTWV